MIIEKNIKKFKYEQISDYIIGAIQKGTIGSGSKIPSLRMMSKQFNCAMSVVMQAYQELEMNGYILAVEKSGYFAQSLLEAAIPSPQTSNHSLISQESKTNNMTGRMLEISTDTSILPLGCAIPDASILPLKRLQRLIVKKTKDCPDLLCGYTQPKGSLSLRQQLASLMLTRGVNVTAEDILITNGCMEALVLALKSVTKEGDIVAIESPIFFGLITILEQLNRRVIELPTSPSSGIDLDALKHVFQKKEVRACMFSTGFQNPLGFLMPEENRKTMIELALANDVTLIEDDIYGECSFYNESFRPTKSFDPQGQAIYCSSFSKLISPGMRVGWLIAGKHQNCCENIKVTETLGSSGLLQETMAEFLENGGYAYHKRLFSKKIAAQTYQVRRLISDYFPADTKITNPFGGYFLWVELAKGIDSMQIFAEALNRKIGIIPGPIFSTSGKYKNCIRISCGSPVDENIENGIMILGELIKKKK